MRHRSTAPNSLHSVGNESRSHLPNTLERSRTMDYQHNLSLLEEDWNNNQHHLSASSSVSSSLFDACQCCNKPDCESMDYFNRTVRKLESDTRLAAEIGQGLLQKHETFVKESNQQKARLQNQLKECHEKITELEQSLDELETSKDKIQGEKNKWSWEFQKRQKILDETLVDLEGANEKCKQLSIDMETKDQELDKLRMFKFMMRQSEKSEETLRAKLEDTNQELAICRKNELVLESKLKKLKVRYESLKEQLPNDSIETSNALSTHVNKNDTTKFVVPSSSSNNTNDLISLIKEISSANQKLKSDLACCKEQLSDAQAEIDALMQKIDDDSMNTETPKASLQDMMKKSQSTTTNNRNKKEPIPIRSSTTVAPPPPSLSLMSSSLPTSATLDENSPGSPIVHHHYHYYVKGNKESDSNTYNVDNNDDIDFVTQRSNEGEMMMSPSNSTTTKDGTTTPCYTKSPYFMLQEIVSKLLERLRASDIRALNRKLKRVFDITELSAMSNSILDNILADISTMGTRFLWVDTALIEGEVDSDHIEAFHPILNLIKDTLHELGTLRTTMNELQVVYVKKVEEDQARVEEEVMRKREKRLKDAVSPASVSTNVKPLVWLTSMFYKSTIDTPNNNNNNNNTMAVTRHYIENYNDQSSTLTKTTTDSSVIMSPDEDDQHANNFHIRREDATTNNYHSNYISRNNTFPSRQQLNNNYTNTTLYDNNNKRRPIPHFPLHTPPSTIPTTLKPSISSGANSNSAKSIPIRNKRNMHRVNIDYEGIGPVAIRPIPSESREISVNNFSSSWLGGK